MKILFLIICLFAVRVNAQTGISPVKHRKAENRVIIAWTPQWYFNQGGVYNDGRYPDVISARNTGGYVAGLEYERVTKGGIMMNIGLQYGRQRHDVDVTYKSLDFFDILNQEQLSQMRNGNNYSANVGYVGMKFMLGYRWVLPSTFLKNWGLEAKAGFSFRVSTTQSGETIVWRIGYESNDTLYLTDFGDDVMSFGKKSTLGSMAWSHNADLYLGLNKPVHWGFIKNISLGVFATYGIGGKYKGIGSVKSSTFTLRRELISQDEYRSQDFSIGLRLAMGLWPR
jgi:hypothetical protein